jgi:bacterioferritin-associated ferredoxin
MVCSCLGVSHDDFIASIDGSTDFAGLVNKLLVGFGCATCITSAARLYKDHTNCRTLY